MLSYFLNQIYFVIWSFTISMVTSFAEGLFRSILGSSRMPGQGFFLSRPFLVIALCILKVIVDTPMNFVISLYILCRCKK